MNKQVVFFFLVFVFFADIIKAQFPFSEGFESGNLTSGMWNVSGGAQVTTSYPATGNYCLEGPATWGINRTFTSSNVQLLTVEFKVRTTQTNTTCMIFRIKDSNGSTAAGTFFDQAGNINATDSSGPGSTITLLQYTIDRWYAFRFEFNFAAMQYDLYIDNILVANDYVFYSPSFYDPYLFTWSSVATSGSAWVDDINIFEGTVSIDDKQKEKPYHFYFDQDVSQIYIQSDADKMNSVSIYNPTLQLIEQCEFTSTSMNIDFSKYSQGIYFVVLHSSRRDYLEKILR